MGFDPSGVVMVAIFLAIGAVLLLSLFRDRMPARLRGVIEKALGVGYPLVVGVAFAALSWRAYLNAETTQTIGFAVGGVIMVILAARSSLRGMGRR